MGRIESRLKQAAKKLHKAPEIENIPMMRHKELPPAQPAIPVQKSVASREVVSVAIEEVHNPDIVHRRAQEYLTMEVASSKGKIYKITIPASYAPNIPKVWSWDARRLKAAELLAIGFPVSQVVQDPEVCINSRHIIYAWLQHPEFKEHVDALVLETGFASQRERIAGLSRLTQQLYDRILRDTDAIPLTEKSIGALISGVLGGMKQLAQEKGEFIEQQNVTQQTTIDGRLATANLDVSELLKSHTEEERKELEQEFDAMGNDIIRNLIGNKAAE